MAGLFANVVSLTVPESAIPGDVVEAILHIQNIYGAPIFITATGRINDNAVYFGSMNVEVQPGETVEFTESFIMPDTNTTVYAWSWYMAVAGIWEFDDTASAEITVAEGALPPSTKIGELISVGIKIPGLVGTYQSLPAANVLSGDAFSLEIVAKNNTSAIVELSIGYTITKPSSAAITKLSDEKLPLTAPYETEEFTEGPGSAGTLFDVDESGIWFITVDLYSDDEKVDTYTIAMFNADGETPLPGGGTLSGVLDVAISGMMMAMMMGMVIKTIK